MKNPIENKLFLDFSQVMLIFKALFQVFFYLLKELKKDTHDAWMKTRDNIPRFFL